MTQPIDYAAVAPLLLAAGMAVVVLVADLVLPLASRAAVLWLGVLGAAGAGAAGLALGGGPVRRTFCVGAGTLPGGVRVGESCSYEVNRFTVYLVVLLCAAAAVALLASVPYARSLPPGEYTLLVLASLTGALTLVGARDLLTLVVGLETLTLPTYVLVGLRRGDRRSGEAAVKYLLVSVAASAVMLLGVALTYGLTGAVHLDRIAAALAARPDVASLPVGVAAMVLVLAGFGFKVTLVPFHWWTPDVYQGAPVPVAAYLATVSKAGGVGGLLLVVLGAFPRYASTWGPALGVLAAASMTLGNLVALRQRDAVRLLAWSSIAHAGYLVAPLGIAATARGRGSLDVAVAATLGYLALYVAMNLGAFVCLAALTGRTEETTVGGRLGIAGLRGLAGEHPWLAGTLAFFLVCLAGLPPGLAGLVAKVVVVRATLLGGAGWLAVFLAVNTVVGLAYYLRVAAALFRPVPPGRTGAADPGADGAGPAGAPLRLRLAPAAAAAVGVATVATVVLGFAPQLALGAVP